MIDFTWSVLTQIVAWGQAAHATARKKSEQRYARIVEHSAVLVSAVATLNRQLHAMLQPLAYFDPAEWDQARRTEHVNALIAYGTEETILPKMRASRSTLRGLLVDSDDADVRRSAGRILTLTDDLFDDPETVIRRIEERRSEGGFTARGPRDEERSDFTAEDPGERAASTGYLIEDAVMKRDAELPNPEVEFNRGLSGLLRVLRQVELQPVPPPDLDPDGQDSWHRRREAQTEHVQSLAQGLLATRPVDRYDAEPADDGLQGVLFPAASEMQTQFGELLAVSQRAFPTMPTPTFTL